MNSGISTNSIMRQIVIMLDTPVKLILIVMLVISLILVGGLIAELLERKYLQVKAASVIDAIKKGDNDVTTIIKNSSLLIKQKRLLLELTIHKSLSNEMKENFATSLLDNYNQNLDWTIKKTDLIIKLGPTFGLLGTLIPLGPGIIALSQGDTATLSYSLLAAFDTTVIGLIAGSICAVISMIRRRWYAKDRIMLTLIMEAVLESECKGDKNEK
ncbi:MAG: MotA/TolQ/ExbB proton channel family protein [Lachnospiraceae bacterium]|nr:MotA/TolQ/ExbB proton channel family protein [Lachnospiraceae bacterium]